MEYVSPMPHKAHILSPRVPMLSIDDGVNKTITELPHGPKQVGLDKIDHAVVWWRRRINREREKGESELYNIQLLVIIN